MTLRCTWSARRVTRRTTWVWWYGEELERYGSRTNTHTHTRMELLVNTSDLLFQDNFEMQRVMIGIEEHVRNVIINHVEFMDVMETLMYQFADTAE
mmetsp:Transcript_628/g.1671  ORF Transcript_628/g.1671 Transcript_628/m.1671 type:complete len:96 (+) Transcript_628:244-531(+)